MNTDNARIETTVFGIAETLMQQAKEDVHGPYWVTPLEDADGMPQESTDLFNGNAGIILLLLEIHQYKPAADILTFALRAASRLLKHADVQQPVFYPFYTGATSVLWLCMRLHEATGEEWYLQHALELTRSYESGILESVIQHDLLSGHAGNLLLLSHLYVYTKNEYYLSLVKRLSDQIIDNARIAPQGLKWDPVKHACDSLTCFSHGSAGIGFALMQVGRCFHSEGLIWLGEEALRYEMLYHDARRNNWMDLRVGVQRMQRLKEQYGWQLMDWPLPCFYSTMSNVNAWAHGAAGSGISRLYAYRATGNVSYLQHVWQAVDRCRADLNSAESMDYTLCSGRGGIAMFFLEAAFALEIPELQTAAQQTALAGIRYNEKHGTYNSRITTSYPDYGLLSGLAGVGYFMLRTISQPADVSILCPSLSYEGGVPAMQSYTIVDVKRRIFNRYYPHTLPALMQRGAVTETDILRAADIISLQQQLEQQLDPAISGETSHFSNEKQVVSLWMQHKGWLYHQVRRELMHEAMEAFLAAGNDQQQYAFITSTHVRLCDYPVHTLWYSHETGISSQPVGKLTALILLLPEQPYTLNELAAHLLRKHFPDQSAADIFPLVAAQVKELLKSGWVTIVRKEAPDIWNN
ncbi:lanthionine synthetase LanC family protein [Chitinophaga sp. 212800010-3]|uniref:lanthionine synthetase LanC family protein n=1 Tax=unclassified Chitinophaga TaxID=2619133 RepID=UPI002DE800B7|nr:hypothetical protein [Chitinophaga sp. 212800010-3]